MLSWTSVKKCLHSDSKHKSSHHFQWKMNHSYVVQSLLFDFSKCVVLLKSTLESKFNCFVGRKRLCTNKDYWYVKITMTKTLVVFIYPFKQHVFFFKDPRKDSNFSKCLCLDKKKLSVVRSFILIVTIRVGHQHWQVNVS